jgi:hypothetical protein
LSTAPGEAEMSIHTLHASIERKLEKMPERTASTSCECQGIDISDTGVNESNQVVCRHCGHIIPDHAAALLAWPAGHLPIDIDPLDALR